MIAIELQRPAREHRPCYRRTMLDEGTQIVAVAAVVFRDAKLLAMRRAAHRDAGAGLWETMSGRLRLGEQPLAGLAREVQEESGLEVDFDPRPIDAYAAMRGDRPMTVLVYRGDWLKGEVQRSGEHDAHAWCTPDEFAERTTLSRLAEAVRRCV